MNEWAKIDFYHVYINESVILSIHQMWENILW